MNEQITSAAELDALHMAVSIAAQAALVMDSGNRDWLVWEGDGGDLWATSYHTEDDETDIRSRILVDAELLHFPLTVLYCPGQPQRVDSPAAGCTCTGYSEDRGGGHHEYMLEYDPGCPEHSQHAYNPRTQMWEQVEPQRVQPSREDVVAALKGVWFNLSDEFLGRFADAVLALFASAPTVAEVKAEAWDEGHRHAWRRGPDECMCSAWSSNECMCGLYGSGELLSLADNPYREARP